MIKPRCLDSLALQGNPRYYSCLLDEDMMRRVAGWKNIDKKISLKWMLVHWCSRNPFLIWL